MTKKLSTSPAMELDFDSFLKSLADGGDDDDTASDSGDSNAFPRRTVDDILNDSDAESSSSSADSPDFLHLTALLPKKEPEIPVETPPNPDSGRITSRASNFSEETEQYSSEKPPSEAIGSLTRQPSVQFSSSSFSLGRNYSHHLLGFGGVKANPKPGAALAAAAAASRPVPSPHAAAIKFRRASRDSAQRLAVDRESEASVYYSDDERSAQLDDVCDDVESLNTRLDEKSVEEDEIMENSVAIKDDSGKSADEEIPGVETAENLPANDKIGVSEEVLVEIEKEEDDHLVDSNPRSSAPLVEEHVSPSSESDGICVLGENSTIVEEKMPSSDFNESSQVNQSSVLEMDVPSSPRNENVAFSCAKASGENEASDHKDGEANVVGDDSNSKCDTNELAEDLVQLANNKKLSKKTSKKLRSSMKPLDLAEELENKYASSGLHWEEGAAAQPMRLEGIRRGPPAVGYLQIDPNNAVTRTISSPAFRRDHGSPLALAVHLNFIAVGMSKGVVVVIPSKYSAHYPDNMDSKMLILGSQGEKSHSPVTSMCFNQQGELLLAGYGDGHLTIWDVQKATPVKIITGEHTAPVVHTLFLGQDSQVTRQFKAVTGDCKGLVLLHTSSVVPLLNRFSIKTQCLLDGQRTGTVLSASPLLMDDFCGSGLTSGSGNSTGAPGGLGGMKSGVVGGEAGWKLFSEGSSSVEEGVVIFVTHQTALVVRLSPSLEVYAQLPKPDGVREGSMPYTAWKCKTNLRVSSNEPAPVEASDAASLLAIAWDRKVQVAKLVKSELKVYREWNLDSAAIGVAWLDDQMLVALTSRGQLCLFAKEGAELHRTSFVEHRSGGDEFITYHTHFTNIFGNPEKAFHNAVAVRGATIYVLGPSHLVVSRLLPWKERIQVLQKAGDWMGALDMAMRLYDGHAHGVIDLPRTVDAIRKAIMPYLVELLLLYVDEVFSYISVAFSNQVGKVEQKDEPKPGNNFLHTEVEDQYARVGGVAVEFCVHIKRTDILFDDIFSRFVVVQQGGTFLELLEPYILKDMLGFLPPEIMQALVEHYSSKGWLQRVEQCVLHMDISSLDFNQVARLCREHGLYGALIYLFNRGLDDFRAPLEELLVVLQNSQRRETSAIGYRMLVYLKYCFMGLAFPPGHGTVPPTRLPLLRTELLQFLLEDCTSANSYVRKSLKSSTGTCPNLFYLLLLDTDATLEVLKCAFPEEGISKPTHSLEGPVDEQMKDDSENDLESPENRHLMVQNTVNSLIKILDMEISEMVTSSGMDANGFREVWPAKRDMGLLLEFISYFVSCKGATVSKEVLDRILQYLTSETDYMPTVAGKKVEAAQRREEQVLALLRSVSHTDWDPSIVLQQCDKAKFYQVCGLVHTIRGHYIAALDSYMKDKDEPVHAFAFINHWILQLRDAELATFQSAVISRIPELVILSREGTVFLVLDHFSEGKHHILSGLQSHRKSLFLYLKSIIEVHLSGTLNFSSLERSHVSVQSRRRMNGHLGELEAYLKRLSSFPKLLQHNSVFVTDEMAELYLELLCQYERGSVLKFLETFENYRVEHCLRLCQDYEITDAAAFLLERVGDVGSALSLTMSGLDDKLKMIDAALENKVLEMVSSSITDVEQFNNILQINEVKDVFDLLHASIGLCQRNTLRLDPNESESLWFRLLDSFGEPLRSLYAEKRKFSEVANHGNKVAATSKTQADREPSFYRWRISTFEKGSQILQRVLSKFISEIIDGMVGYVPLPTIMAKLLSDNANHEFGDFKFTIMGMLGTYGYERRILDTAKSLIEDDTFYTMSLLKKGASHAYAPQSFMCCLCGCTITKDSTSSVRVFSCGHATHLHCESQENEVLNQDSSIGCPICMPKKKSRRARNKSILVDNGLVKNPFSGGQQARGNTNALYIHEYDLVEKPYGLQQMSRFEILSNLGKAERPFQIDSMPQLRLAPPATYHEKVKKATDLVRGESSNTEVKSENPSKMRQSRALRGKASSLRFPLKSSIFSK